MEIDTKLLVWMFFLIQALTTAQEVSKKDVTCNTDDIQLDLLFGGRFNGIVYAKDYFSRSRCRQEGEGSRTMRFSLELNTCGVNEDDDIAEVTIIVQKNPDVILDGDEAYHITCDYGTQVGDTVNLNVGLRPNDLPTESLDSAAEELAVVMSILPDNDAFRDDEVTEVDVGDTIVLAVDLVDTDDYESFRLYSCTAEDNDGNELSLVDDDGCVESDAYDQDIVSTPTVRRRQNQDDEYRKYFEMKAFKFPDMDQVTFKCVVTQCEPDDTSCSLQCDAQSDEPENVRTPQTASSRRRFKRGVEEIVARASQITGTTKRTTPTPPDGKTRLFGTVTVNAPQLEPPTTTETPEEEAEKQQYCFTVSYLVACACIVFGLIMMAFTACLCFCVRWHRDAKARQLAGDSQQSILSTSSRVDMTRIPRPSLIQRDNSERPRI